MISVPHDATPLQNASTVSTPPPSEKPAMSSAAQPHLGRSHSEVGPVGIGKMAMPSKPAMQPKKPIQHLQQAANVRKNGKSCFTCKKSLSGGVSTKLNNTIQNFCNTSCLARALEAPPKTPAVNVRENGKRCFTCKKAILGAGVGAMRNNVVFSFCDRTCFERVQQISAPKTNAVRQRRPVVANPRNPIP